MENTRLRAEKVRTLPNISVKANRMSQEFVADHDGDNTVEEDPTYLRIRRRRQAGTALTMIRMVGIEDDNRKRGRTDDEWIGELAAGLSLTTQTSEENEDLRRVRPRSAVWRKISSEEAEHSAPPRGRRRASFRVIDAVFSDDESGDPGSHDHRPKRRRLTLVDANDFAESLIPLPQNAGSNQQQSYKVLDPAQRLVDDSLQLVFSSEISPAEHFNFVTTDERLVRDMRSWLSWSNAELGNLLHACAFWNETEIARELLSRGVDGIADEIDAGGRTPYQVAEAARNSEICEVLEAFGADCGNFVYDVYRMDEPVSAKEEESIPQEDVDDTVSCELNGGFGYWNDDGRLVLEPAQNANTNNQANDGDAEDSNDEDWLGNDYPDEDWGESDSDDDDDGYGRHLRNSAGLNEDDFDGAFGIVGQNDEDM